MILEKLNTLERTKADSDRTLAYTLRPAEERDLSQILTIADQQLGADYFGSTLTENLEPFHLFTVAEHQGNILGFCSGMLFPAFDPPSCLSEVDLPRKVIEQAVCGLLKTVATRPDFELAGIASQLIEYNLKELQRNGAEIILGLAWKDVYGRINVGTIMQKLGFRILKEYPNFWYTNSLKQQYKCPVCGNPPCRCSAVLYGLEACENNPV